MQYMITYNYEGPIQEPIDTSNSRKQRVTRKIYALFNFGDDIVDVNWCRSSIGFRYTTFPPLTTTPHYNDHFSLLPPAVAVGDHCVFQLQGWIEVRCLFDHLLNKVNSLLSIGILKRSEVEFSRCGEFKFFRQITTKTQTFGQKIDRKVGEIFDRQRCEEGKKEWKKRFLNLE